MADAIDIDEKNLEEYINSAKDFCLVNGLVIFPVRTDETTPNTHNSSICLPVTLLPTKFSKQAFEYAVNIQNKINLLIHKLSLDKKFLNESLNDVIKVDDFTNRLWGIYETVMNEGLSQDISFGVIRSDYMVDSNKNNQSCSLSQVEINTIASSFGAATTKLYKLHRYMLNRTNNEKYIEKQPNNKNIEFLANGMIKAWSLYGNKNAQIGFIVSKNERNIGDQRLLEYEILNQELGVKIIRLTLEEIHEHASLDSEKRLKIYGIEIGLIYYRAGYSPNDYSSENDWLARLLIERSKAIKCPSIHYHLAGAKKIQQALSETGICEHYIDQESSKLIRATFVDQYSFDNKNSEEFEKLVSMMIKNCEDFVLKPQREGGGNNIYGEDIKKFINELKDRSELKGYILMKLIRPVVRNNYMIKNDSNKAIKGEFINEIGIYGCIIGDSKNVYLNETGGYLLRSKQPTTNEGGVAAGFSALDSIYLD